MRRQAAITVDVDSLDCYYAIHALGEVPAAARHLVWERAIPRFAALFAQHGVKATFFVVGRDLDHPAARRLAAELAAAGHELANHSETHPYDLVARGQPALRDEIARTHGRLGELVGRAPAGFRAPGYNVTPQLFETLAALGYRYDSSLFPSPPYYAAKAAVMAALRLGGRRSRSYLGDPRQLAAPVDPYRAALRSPWARAGAGPGLTELPVTVSPLLRFPVIGTSLLVSGPLLRRALLWSTLGRPLFNLELHGIELLDAELDDVPAELVRRQPDLRRPLAHKTRALEEVLTFLRGHHDLATLEQIARRLGDAATAGPK